MPQVQMPIFPSGVTHITPHIAFQCEDGKVCYLNGHLPVFIHDQKDLQTFRLFTTQLIVNGSVKQGDIARAFGVPVRTVKRYVKRYRENGAKGFYAPPKTRSASKLTGDVLRQAQELLDEGQSIPEVGRTLGLLSNTLNKAVHAERLHRNKKKRLR
jgi:transposase